MRPSGMHYFPLAWPFILALGFIFVFLVALIELHILKYAYQRMGVPSRYVLGVLLLSLLGSAINIPVAELPPEKVVSNKVVEYYGVQHVVPEVEEWPRTIIAINVGGALVPVILSLYLVFKNGLYLKAAIAVAALAAITHYLAEPVQGVGISVPIFLPPLAAALVAFVLAWQEAAPLAYIAGSMGTLIGADLLNLEKIHGLGAPVASIGGAGTFDGVFLAGILAVLIAPVAGKPTEEERMRDEGRKKRESEEG